MRKAQVLPPSSLFTSAPESCITGFAADPQLHVKTFFSMRIPMGWRKWLLIILAGACAWALVEVALPSAGDARAGATGICDHRCFHPCASHGIRSRKGFSGHPSGTSGAAHRLHPHRASRQGVAVHVLPRGRGSGPRGAHSRGERLHDLPPGRSPPTAPRSRRSPPTRRAAKRFPGCASTTTASRRTCASITRRTFARGVDCATCHSDMTKQTTAERKVNMNMGFCINCHTQKQVSIDCETCHY